MKIVYVAGGSYKSFYLNCFLKLSKLNLLIFNYDILYDYNYSKELLGNNIVTKELMMLSKTLNCVVVAGIYVIRGSEKTKSLILCNGDKLEISKAQTGIEYNYNNVKYIIGDEKTNYKNSCRIVISNKRIYPVKEHCSFNKNYLFCDKHGVTIIQNQNLTRKFNKYSKIILK